MSSDPAIPLQSGIPPARLSEPHTAYARGEAHAQAALAASLRTEAGLGGLFRTIQHLSATVNAARDANDQLVREIEHVRELLANGDQEQLSLKRQVAVLEQSVTRAEREAERERSFLVDQHDRFIVHLCVDHEREMAALEQQVIELREALRVRKGTEEAAAQAATRVAELEQRLEHAEHQLIDVGGEREAMRQQLARLHGQRVEAETALVRIASERDQAMIELSRVRSNGSPRSPSRAEASGPISELILDPFPRESLQSAVDTPLFYAEEVTPTRPLPALNPPGILKQKPDPSTRPLIGYSFAGEDLEEEHLEGSRISTRPKSR